MACFTGRVHRLSAASGTHRFQNRGLGKGTQIPGPEGAEQRLSPGALSPPCH